MAKPMNMERRLKLEPAKDRPDPVQLEMMLKFRNRRFVDRKREQDRQACRGKVQY